MISPTLKIAGTIVGAGGVIAGGATGIYYLNNKEEQKVVIPEKKKISSLLATDNRTLLDDNKDAGEWTRVWGEFSTAHKSKDPDGAWEIKPWATKKVQDQGLPELKSLCKKNAKEEVELDKKGKLYEEVKKYCTKETKPSEIP